MKFFVFLALDQDGRHTEAAQKDLKHRARSCRVVEDILASELRGALETDGSEHKCSKYQSSVGTISRYP